MLSVRFLLLLVASASFVGCASGTFKARQEQREKLAASSGMYCEFISGDLFPDLDVELSTSMAKRCDSGKAFSITNYKNSSDQTGVMYCCALAAGKQRAAASAKKSMNTTPSASSSSSAPKVDSSEAEVIPEQ